MGIFGELFPADAGLERARQCVEAYLSTALAKSSVSNVDLTLRFIPIVMPMDMHERYNERSKARVKQRIYDCAPHLDYDVFVSGTLEQQVCEYLRGIAMSAPHLHKFGITLNQVQEFEQILNSATDQILNVQLDRAQN